MNNSTTASMAVEYPGCAASPTVWFTGTSIPCVSLFKPVVIENGEFLPLVPGWSYEESGGTEADPAFSRWMEHYKLISEPPRSTRPRIPLSTNASFLQQRDKLQERLIDIVARYSRERRIGPDSPAAGSTSSGAAAPGAAGSGVPSSAPPRSASPAAVSAIAEASEVSRRFDSLLREARQVNR